MAKSLVLTYIIWFFSGWFGCHHFYLNRDRHAFVMWMSLGGYFGLGWIRDMWRIPEYVKDANNDAKYLEGLAQVMRQQPKPSTGMVRHFATIIVADILGYLAISAIPIELLPDNMLILSVIMAVAAPLAIAIGVHTVGNIGRQKGDLKWALIGAYLTSPLYFLSTNVVFWTSMSSNYFFNKYSKEWRRTPNQRKSLIKRLSVLLICSVLYLSLWSSWFYYNCSIVDKTEAETKCRDATKNFLNSPMWKECRKVFDDLRLYISVNGWSGLWREIMDAFDPQGEKNALKVLNLSSKATQEEITTTYRKLSRQWHPDKHKDPIDKLTAQEKFMQIQTAYEILSKIKRQRIKNQNTFE